MDKLFDKIHFDCVEQLNFMKLKKPTVLAFKKTFQDFVLN